MDSKRSLLALLLTLALVVYQGHAFALPGERAAKYRNVLARKTPSNSILFLNLGGFFSGNKNQNSDEATLIDEKGLGDFFETMENLESAQKVGKTTSSLLQELKSNTVEGQAQDGKVKVTFDCQQRPLRVVIDEGYYAEADAAEMSQSLTAAIQDAHAKSIEKMDDKMKNLYSELGL